MAKHKSSKPFEGPPVINDDWWSAVFAAEENSASLMPGASSQHREIASVSRGSKNATDWNRILKFLEDETILECKVVARNQGGFIVEHEEFQGFVPVSHLLTVQVNTPESNQDDYVGISLMLRVIECDPDRGRVVLSERATQTAAGESKRLMATLEKGKVLQGAVTNITKFGVFVDIGGVEGLVHISELSWRRVGRPEDMVQLGEQVEALVLQVDRRRKRVALSFKHLHPNPWDSATDRFQPGDIFEAEVTEVVRYGAFARLEKELEGLIHVSEMRLDNGVHPWKVYKKGQIVTVRILKVNPEKQRLSLGLEATE